MKYNIVIDRRLSLQTINNWHAHRTRWRYLDRKDGTLLIYIENPVMSLSITRKQNITVINADAFKHQRPWPIYPHAKRKALTTEIDNALFNHIIGGTK